MKHLFKVVCNTLIVLVLCNGFIVAKASLPQWQRIEINQASRVVVVQGATFGLWVDGKALIGASGDSSSSVSSGDSVRSPEGNNSAASGSSEQDWQLDGEWLQLRMLTAKEIRVQQPHLKELKIRGAANLRSEGRLKEELLRIALSGVGNIELDLDCGELLVDLSGLGRLELAGLCSKARIDINGPGAVDARRLQTRQAKVFIDGLGLCKIDVTDSLYADISGGGSIRYRKEPAYLVNRISGLGSVAAWEEGGSTGAAAGEGASRKKAPAAVNPRGNGGDYWSRKNQFQPRVPVLEWGLSGWSNGSSYGEGTSAYQSFNLESERSWFLQWWTPLKFQAPWSEVLGSYRESGRKGNGAEAGPGRRGSLWVRGALCFTFQEYRFEDNLVLGRASKGGPLAVTRVDSTNSPDFVRSNLSNNLLSFPLGLVWSPGARPDRGWHWGFFAMPGLRLWTTTRNTYRDAAGRVELYRTGSFALSPFALTLRSEAGKGKIRIFTQYTPTPMFRKGMGPDLNKIEFGVTFWNR